MDELLCSRFRLFCELILKIVHFNGRDVHCWRLAVRLMGLSRVRHVNGDRKWARRGKKVDPEILGEPNMDRLNEQNKEKAKKMVEFDALLAEADESRWDLCVLENGNEEECVLFCGTNTKNELCM